MRQERVSRYDKFMERLCAIANWVVRILGVAIFLWLLWYAFRYTQYMNPGGAEYPINVRGSLSKSILFLAGACGLLFGLLLAAKKVPEKIQKRLDRITLVLTVVWVLAAGLWWITSIDRQPTGDQAFIYGAASYFMEDAYFFFSRGAYCDMCPHQLNLIFWVELLFRLVGAYNYHAFQVLNVFFCGGIVLLGSSLVRRSTGQPLLCVGSHVLFACCLPMIFYTGWVYGDIPSAFFILLIAELLAAYYQRPHWGYLAGMVPAVVLAVMLRQNSLIYLVALVLIGGLFCLLKKDKKLALAIVLAVICPFLATGAVNRFYEVRSGEEVGQGGFPATAYIAMGLRENDGKFGWYTNISQEIYYSVDCDTKRADVICRAEIADRIVWMRENPDYTRMFFREKLLSQWNAPLYQSLHFASQYEGREFLPKDSPEMRLTGDYFPQVLGLCDGLQFVIYVGALCYYLFAVKKDSCLLLHFLAVGVIGGFLFSIIWEVKARYALPYYLSMYPVAVIGYWSLFTRIMMLIGKIRGEKSADGRWGKSKAA